MMHLQQNTSVGGAFAKSKYAHTAEKDNIIIGRVAGLASRYNASMTTASLSWLL